MNQIHKLICKFKLILDTNPTHLYFRDRRIFSASVNVDEITQIIENDCFDGYFIPTEIPVSSFHAALCADLFEATTKSNSPIDFRSWINTPISDRYRRGLDALRHVLHDEMPAELSKICVELHDSWNQQAMISASNESLPYGNTVFKIESSEAVDVWDKDANFALTYHSKVILEVQIKPVLLARLFGIPSQSAPTIDEIVQMCSFPVSRVEALIFASFAGFAVEKQKSDDDDVLREWGTMTIEDKLRGGFDLIGRVIGHIAPDHVLQTMWEDLSKVQTQRTNIYKQYAQWLGDEPEPSVESISR